MGLTDLRILSDSTKENVQKTITRLPGPGPDNINFGTGSIAPEYIGTNAVNQIMVLPLGTVNEEGRVIWVKSLGEAGSFLSVQTQGGQVIDGLNNEILIPPSGGVKLIWSWNGGVDPTWLTY